MRPDPLDNFDAYVSAVHEADRALGALRSQGADVLRRLLNETGTSQNRAARLAGVTPAYVSKVLNGKCDPTLSFMERLLRGLEDSHD